MKFLETLMGFRDLWDEARIRGLVARHEHLSEGDAAAVALLRIFLTSKQSTWLARTPGHLVCVLDDVRSSEPRVQWSIPIERAVDHDGQVRLPLKVQDRTDRTAMIDLGRSQPWLVSKNLFTGADPADRVREFLRGPSGSAA